MTAADVALPGAELDRPEVPQGLVWVWRDSWTEAMRHLRAVPRNPELLVFAAVQPLMFVLLFVYVFGGSIQIPGMPEGAYVQYLVPGIFAQTMVFNSAFTGVGIAEDLSKGIIDRLRSLPMFTPAVLIGRTMSDAARNLFTFVVMFTVGFAIGFRVNGGLVAGITATLLLLLFSYAFSWIQAFIGLSVKSVEAANSGGFIWMFPMTFISSAFVSPDEMVSWLQPIAKANPFTKLTNATRALYNGGDPGSDLWIALAWAFGLTAVFAVLATRKFSRTASR